MVIKYWNKEQQDYETDTERFMIDKDFTVYYAPLNYHAEPFFHLEPHFYKDGERIA